ncbi:MAG: hypothetical protein LRY61_07075 [Burkholderiaceae bacterium]|nr:hypothetical protein [Burkholderiaceae bacterium]MCD8517012.1 hypothetical protein [Burkholderiaceae bacterium]
MQNTTTVVVTDANILVNFCHIDYFKHLGSLGKYRLLVPDEVYVEITSKTQKTKVDDAFEAGILEGISIRQIDTLRLFSQLRDIMGKGESACLALAYSSGHHLASDEKRLFRRKALELVGQERILRTEDFIAAGIRAGTFSIAEADFFKQVLAKNKYAMKFSSFSEFVSTV